MNLPQSAHLTIATIPDLAYLSGCFLDLTALPKLHSDQGVIDVHLLAPYALAADAVDTARPPVTVWAYWHLKG